ncbi:MAG: metal ABC transporter permease, partial [Solirubrobacterales bacterium]
MGPIELLTEPLSFGTTWRAIVEMTILGVAGGVIGCWVVLYRLSYGAESLAHGMLPGLVLAGLVGLPLLLGGAMGILVAGLLVAAAKRIRRSDTDNALAVAVTTLFGAGILMALSPASPSAVGELLFGNLLGTTDAEILISAAATVLTIAVVWTLHPRLLAIGFDGDAGGFVRMPTTLITL